MTANHTVWKFGPIYPRANTILMPEGAQILSVGFQGSDMVIWALVDPAMPLTGRRIGVIPTGLESLPDDGYKYRFVGTAVHVGTAMGLFPNGTVWHIFEVGE